MKRLRIGAVREYLGRVEWRQLLVLVSAVVGWTLVTWGLVDLLGWWVAKVSSGVVVLGLVGYRLLWRIASKGLYWLARDNIKDDSV